jgi:hypothetical protein
MLEIPRRHPRLVFMHFSSLSGKPATLETKMGFPRKAVR